MAVRKAQAAAFARPRLTFVLAGLPLGLLALRGAPVAPVAAPIVFEEMKAGIPFVTEPDRTKRKHQPETMVSGVALLDFDGRLDVYAVNGATMPGLDKADPKFHNRLYRSRGDGTFEDVTAPTGGRTCSMPAGESSTGKATSPSARPAPARSTAT